MSYLNDNIYIVLAKQNQPSWAKQNLYSRTPSTYLLIQPMHYVRKWCSERLCLTCTCKLHRQIMPQYHPAKYCWLPSRPRNVALLSIHPLAGCQVPEVPQHHRRHHKKKGFLAQCLSSLQFVRSHQEVGSKASLILCTLRQIVQLKSVQRYAYWG